MPKVSILIPSFNKGKLCIEGIQSVLNQTFTDFELVVVDNSTDLSTRLLVSEIAKTDKRINLIERDFSEEERLKEFVGSVIINEYLPKLTGDYIIYKSDDDLLAPNCLQTCVDYLDAYPGAHVGWFSMKVTEEQPDGNFAYLSEIKAELCLGLNTSHPKVDCMLDGGQIVYRKECLKKLTQPLYPADFMTASHGDGIFMDQLAQHYTFYPISKEYLLEHRRTKISVFTGGLVK